MSQRRRFNKWKRLQRDVRDLKRYIQKRVYNLWMIEMDKAWDEAFNNPKAISTTLKGITDEAGDH